MDNLRDYIAESDVEALQLNAQNFGRWLVNSGLISKEQLDAEPWLVAEMVVVDEYYENFKNDQLEAYEEYRDNQVI